MSNLNPFKMISNIENQDIQFKKIGILEAIGVGIIYVMLAVLVNSFSIYTKSLLLTSIFKIFILTLMFVIVVFLFYKLYTVETLGRNDLSRNVKALTIKNIAFLTISIVGIRLIASSIDVYLILFQKITISPMLDESKTIGEITIYFILYECILGPIMEEFVFRGVILGGLLKKYSAKVAILVSALIFGIYHISVIQFITSFFIGIFLAYLYVKIHSIYFCMFSHMVLNTIGLLYVFKYSPRLLLLLILCFIIGFIFMIWGFKKLTSNINKSKLYIM